MISSADSSGAAPLDRVAELIFVVRGQRVLLDADLAVLYGVATRVLLRAVKRNRERFPEDFMILLSQQEWQDLRSQIVISSEAHGGRRYTPHGFTEQGVAMLSSVLCSERVVAVNIAIMRAFVKVRELLGSNKELARRLDELEARLDKKPATHDEAIAAILSAIRQRMSSPVPKRRPIGFTADLGRSGPGGARVRLTGGDLSVTPGPFDSVLMGASGYALFHAQSRDAAVKYVREFIGHFAGKPATSVAGGIALRCWMQRLAPSTRGGIRPDIGGSLAQAGPSLQVWQRTLTCPARSRDRCSPTWPCLNGLGVGPGAAALV